MNTNLVYEKLTSQILTHEQKVMTLAKIAENSLDVLNIPERTKYFFETGAINDLFEGAAPYRPRYTMPDYQKFVENGSEFLSLTAPKDFDELIFSLMTLYRHVPSITNFPVFLGSLDDIIEPFIEDISDEEVEKKLALFFNYLDRTITDSFCHANIGPKQTRAGEIILKVLSRLNNAVPNLSIKYDPDITPDSFMEKAVLASLECANPAICNDVANKKYYDGRYGISSCYNILPIGGGAHTLTRVTLTKLIDDANGIEHFIEDLLPEVLALIADYMNERVEFFVEKSGFFESSFLVKEGLLDADRFVSMFGVTGLAECVNGLLKDENLLYGRDAKADELAIRIMDKIRDTVDMFEASYSPITGGKFVLHAQVGLDSDWGVTSGVRIPVGNEPENFTEHLMHSAKYHGYFPAGVGDIFPIAVNTEQNPAALVDVVKGAFHGGVHYMSFYSADSDLVRITGYLVKRSEMKKFESGEVVLQNTTHLGSPNYKVNNLAERKVRMV